MSRRDDGFTLVEMMVVMAILALTVAMVLPVSRRDFETRQFAALGHALAAGLRQARMEAIGKNVETGLRFDLERRIAQASGSDREIAIPATVEVRIVTARGDVAGKQAVFRFFPDGTATGGHIDLNDGGKSLRIAVSWLTGGISVESGMP